MITLKHILLGLSTIILLTSTTRAEEPTSPDFFENKIRPLLIKHCIKCHGPKKSESGLRLDTKSFMLKGGDSGPAFIPGKLNHSLILQAIQYQGDLEMPPKKQLAIHEIQTIKIWLKHGAHWPEGSKLSSAKSLLRSGPITPNELEFWSLQPVIKPSVPANNNSHTIHNEIDQFVHQRLAANKLTTRPPATKQTLIRRATYDLTGLPPTPQEIDSFLNDNSPQAFNIVIERLLASKAYGEKAARHWLDVVRYADTAGETADYPTPLSYKYRNWVINALNKDIPYDQFVQLQIAGDLIAPKRINPTEGTLTQKQLNDYRQMITATGFIAISRRFGFDVENYHHLTIQDTIDVVGQSILGLTLGCARCHDHKYDPVTAADYYAWYGIFDSTKYSFPGSEEKKRPYDLFPDVPTTIATKLKTQHDANILKLETSIKSHQQQITQLEKQLDSNSGWLTYLQKRKLNLPVKNDNGKQGVHVWKNNPLPLVGVNTTDTLQKVPGDMPPKSLVVHPNPKEGVGIAWQSPIAGRIRITGKVKDAHNCGDSIIWHIDHIDSNGFHHLQSGAIDKNNSQIIKSSTGHDIELNIKQGDIIELAIMPKTNHGCDLTQIEWSISEINGKQRQWNLVKDVIDDFLESNPNDDQYGNKNTWYFFQVALDRGQSYSGLHPAKISEPQHIALHHKLNHLKTKVQTLQNELNQHKQSPPYNLLYAVNDRDKPVNTPIHLRGEITKPGKIIPRRNLEILGKQPVSQNDGSGRLQLANWLTDKKNPLTARVMVNRIWQQHFGKGLVATENDFGTRGERPTHPELLDWLAHKFMENNWSIKSMHRLIMQSATYQQSSQYDSIAAEIDPDARLLWRHNPRRLSAEEIRDSMLTVSGKLDLTMGMEHPFPPSSSWNFTQHNPFYAQYKTNRRSIYLMQQRLKRHPFLALFDGADTNVSTGRRILTTVPSQSLYLMNNPFVHEQAAALVTRAMQTEKNTTPRLTYIWKLTLARTPNTQELDAANAFLLKYSASIPPQISSEQDRNLKAWNAFARVMLTRNEFLYID